MSSMDFTRGLRVMQCVRIDPDDKSAAAEWHLVVDGRVLARLQAPEPDDMFWTSFEIEPMSQPPDPRLMDEGFWAGDAWRVVSARTGQEAGPVIAALRGLDPDRKRIRLRGVRS